MKINDINNLRKVKLLKTFLYKEKMSTISVNRKDRFFALKNGFLSESVLLYGLNSQNIKQYLSDFARLKTSLINDQYSILLNNKITFESIMKDYVDMPKSLALIVNGNISPLCENESINSIESLLSYLDRYGVCVIKPITGGGGNGVLIIKKNRGILYCNNQEIEIKDFDIIIRNLNNNFISEYIKQGKYGNELNQKTTNTIRILTMVSPETKKAFIPIAVQRIGNKNSAPSDNWTQGGFSAEIDLDSGQLGPGITYPVNGKLEWHDTHPENNTNIKDKIIPNWLNIKEQILMAANKVPFIKYIGWDIVVTDEGYMVIEGNNYSDVNLLQIHRPLLKDENVLNFFKHYKII